jgi:hypothetical protein
MAESREHEKSSQALLRSKPSYANIVVQEDGVVVASVSAPRLKPSASTNSFKREQLSKKSFTDTRSGHVVRQYT